MTIFYSDINLNRKIKKKPSRGKTNVENITIQMGNEFPIDNEPVDSLDLLLFI